jgi:hypothetical protein
MVLAASLLGLSGCGDRQPTGPIAPAATLVAKADESILTNAQETLLAMGLLRTVPLAAPITITKVIPSGGGGISVPGTDFQLQVPNGAFYGKQMRFTITALPGNVVAYDFQPHGYHFRKPLKFVQQLGHTNWKGLKLPPGYRPVWNGAYFADASQIDLTTGQALVNELLPADVNIGGATLSFYLEHFSWYMVSSGRR